MSVCMWQSRIYRTCSIPAERKLFSRSLRSFLLPLYFILARIGSTAAAKTNRLEGDEKTFREAVEARILDVYPGPTRTTKTDRSMQAHRNWWHTFTICSNLLAPRMYVPTYLRDGLPREIEQQSARRLPVVANRHPLEHHPSQRAPLLVPSRLRPRPLRGRRVSHHRVSVPVRVAVSTAAAAAAPATGQRIYHGC